MGRKINSLNRLRNRLEKLEKSLATITKKIVSTTKKGISGANGRILDELIRERNSLTVDIHQCEQKILNRRHGLPELGHEIQDYNIGEV